MAQRGSASLGTGALVIALAALMLLAGPLLDEAADAELSAAVVADAHEAARNGETMARWARRVCQSTDATSLQVEGDEVVCRDAFGQRVGQAVVIAAGARP